MLLALWDDLALASPLLDSICDSDKLVFEDFAPAVHKRKYGRMNEDLDYTIRVWKTVWTVCLVVLELTEGLSQRVAQLSLNQNIRLNHGRRGVKRWDQTCLIEVIRLAA